MSAPEVDIFAIARSTPYPPAAFIFVRQGLEFTVQKIHGKRSETDPPASLHVDGRMLARGLRDFAILQYGLMARTVLRHWHINATDDFGKIVFAMVESGVMHKTDDDSIDDFAGVFDFNEAFAGGVELGKSRGK